MTMQDNRDLTQGQALCAQMRALEAQLKTAQGEERYLLECDWMYVWSALNAQAERDFG